MRRSPGVRPFGEARSGGARSFDARPSRVARFLPPVALAVFLISAATIVWASIFGGTFACDYLAYDTSIRRLLGGGSLYLSPLAVVGPCGTFEYPPPFVLLALPLMLVPPDVAGWIATIGLVLATLASIALLPVEPRIRWLVLLLAGLSWPVIYAIKLGQVGPVLLLLFVLGWRWMDRPYRLGTTIALGIAIKIQPVLLVVWAFLTGRRRAAWIALGAFAVLAFAATLVTGPQAWVDEANLLAGRSQPVTTEGLVTPGRLVVDAGLGETIGWIVQGAVLVVTAIVVVYVLFRGSAVGSYMAVVVASQLVSPILWNHYAMVLLVPVAWLLDRRVWVAAFIPLLSPFALVLITPPAVYPIEYLGTLALVALEARREARFRDVGPGFRWRSTAPSAAAPT